MIGRAARGALATLLAGAALGCGPGFWASPEEYGAYRRTRVEPALEARLAASAAYLARYPGGAHAADVRAWLGRAEAIYYAQKRGSAAGLEAYLEALPQGAFAAEARRELARRAIARAPDEVSSGEDTEARIAAERSARERVAEEIAAWVGRLVDPALWRGQAMVDAPAEVLVPFALALPWPACRPLEDAEARALAAPEGSFRCAKVLSLPYAVTGAQGSEPREATVEIAVVEDFSGRPLHAIVGGPDLFLRLEEARSVRAQGADDAAARVAGIARAVEIAGAAFRAKVSGAACRREPVAPVVLDLGCEGVALRVRAAVEEGEDDQIVISPGGR